MRNKRALFLRLIARNSNSRDSFAYRNRQGTKDQRVLVPVATYYVLTQ